MRRSGKRAARRPRKRHPVPLADILDRSVHRALSNAFFWWYHHLPARVTRNARPISLRSGTLQVHTRTSAWAQELSFIREDLLREVQARVPQANVARLLIRVGPLPDAPPPPRPRPPRVEKLPQQALPGNVARALAGVADDRLRAAIADAACTALAEHR